MNVESGCLYFVVLFSIGAGLLLLSINIQTGKYKSWWLIESTPIVPLGAAYIGMPLSITFFVIASIVFFPQEETRGNIFFYGGGSSLIITCLFALWRPRWLVPKWLLWLEDNHADILDLLKREAQQMERWKWETRLKTQQGLEAWVVEVREKYGG